jgi:acyl transferase domain-containing protein
MAKLSAVVVCPGRGTYNKPELGYLKRFHAAQHNLIAMADAHRAKRGQPAISALDSAASYSAATHSRSDNASPLIFTCSYADFLTINRDRFDIAAVTANSMGWYTALACGGALTAEQGFDVVNAMGVRMHERGTGGQIIHTTLDEEWRPIPGRRETLLALTQSIDDLYVSIELGGMIVFAGSDAAIESFAAQAPAGPGSFPMRLNSHAAFHSPLMRAISGEAKTELPSHLFEAPKIPMIDGRGHIWRPFATDVEALWDYTFGRQITETYDFTRAITVAAREFAPDCLIVLGPGETLGGAVIQSLIASRWRGWESKSGYQAAQADMPFVLSMGRTGQR